MHRSHRCVTVESTAVPVIPTDAQPDAVPKIVAFDSGSSIEGRIATALSKVTYGPPESELGITLQSDQLVTSIADAYKEQGSPSFFPAEWLLMGSCPLPFSSGSAYMARHAVLPTRSASAKEVVTERQDWGPANIEQIFALGPAYRPPGAELDCPITPDGEEKSALCVRVKAEEGEHWPGGDTGLSNWAKAWRADTEGDAQGGENFIKQDVLDGGLLWLRRSDDSYISQIRVHRFDQMDHGSRPRHFSAWFGKDQDHAYQKAQENMEHPDLKVGFSAKLYTLLTRDTKPDTTAGASSQTNTAGSASIND